MDWHRHPTMLVLSSLLALAACDRFGSQRMIDTCVRNGLKADGTLTNAQERANTEAQLRAACAKAALRH